MRVFLDLNALNKPNSNPCFVTILSASEVDFEDEDDNHSGEEVEVVEEEEEEEEGTLEEDECILLTRVRML